MTNKPTDAELIAFAVETGMRVRTGKGVVTFARAVLDKWGQPAPQQEAQGPVAWHVCSVNSDGSLSLEHAAAWEEAAHEHINDAITEHDIEGAGSWVVRPAYHAPQPSPTAQVDALESEYQRGYHQGYEQRDAEVRGALV